MRKLPGFLFIAGCLLSGALTANAQPVALDIDKDAENEIVVNPIEDNLKGYYSQIFNLEGNEIANLGLYSCLEEWLGVPYRYAGKSKSGIDCSGFVSIVYKNALCLDFTGSSSTMYKQVSHIRRDELSEGDLVFFRIKKGISHVGIYLGNNKFVHASRSNGVIVSNLDAPYYKRYFAKGGRLSTP